MFFYWQELWGHHVKKQFKRFFDYGRNYHNGRDEFEDHNINYI